jgi:hypothetical protein
MTKSASSDSRLMLSKLAVLSQLLVEMSYTQNRRGLPDWMANVAVIDESAYHHVIRWLGVLRGCLPLMND